MKDFWTWRKIVLFFSIIGLGIIGLMVADQRNFLNGRKESITAIGNGTPDPLVSGNTSQVIAPKSAPDSAKKQVAPIDGIKKAN